MRLETLIELILSLKLDTHLPAKQFEAAIAQSTVPSTPLNVGVLPRSLN